jgi:hypothetical protein
LRNSARLRSAHGEVGTVDLQQDAGFGDGLVFLPHRVGDGVEIGLLARIVIVAEEQSHHAGRGRAHEFVRGRRLRDCGVEIVGIGLRRAGIAHADRRIAGRRLAARTAGIAEHALGERRKIGEVLVDESVAGAAEARQPVLHVGGVARLRHFTVVDDIDAGGDLLLHHLGDGGAHARGERGGVNRLASLLGVHHADEVVGPRQAAGMGGEEALGAVFHGPINRDIHLFVSHPRREVCRM